MYSESIRWYVQIFSRAEAAPEKPPATAQAIMKTQKRRTEKNRMPHTSKANSNT